MPRPEVIVFPGGLGTRGLMRDEPMLAHWLALDHLSELVELVELVRRHRGRLAGTYTFRLDPPLPHRR